MAHVAKGSKTELAGKTYMVTVTGPAATSVDLMAIAVGADGRVLSDDDFVFFNNPRRHGITLTGAQTIQLSLNAIPDNVQRVVIAASTEAQGLRFGEVGAITADITATAETLQFVPDGLSTETVLQLVAVYRRNGRWRLDAIGQGYDGGLAEFAGAFGIAVDEPGTPADTAAAPAPVAPANPTPAAKPIDMTKVSVVLTKDSPNQTAKIDLRKSQGDPSWVLTVGLEWDGRGAVYDGSGRVKRYGKGDLDVYFFCRNEVTNEYVVISGDNGHRGNLNQWPFVYHYGDSMGPGRGNRPAVEQVRVLPQENGDLLVNIYQSVDNGAGAINTFGRPRCVIRYGRAGADGFPGPDADEIIVQVGNNKNSYWATVAHIDVQDGILTVDGTTRYSTASSENMPGLNTAGKWVRNPSGGPVGQSKQANRGKGLTRYSGRCHPAPKPRKKSK
ncbi:TerD family protein [Mycolicibacterium llatzerense]|uniref:TerD family protein n=1 Tax=Mycolicibacterium llatzerense TaxID=280871 RepID=UPI000A5BEBD7|nr:TerD family protein [Mycolicibacterium llatzerense]